MNLKNLYPSSEEFFIYITPKDNFTDGFNYTYCEDKSLEKVVIPNLVGIVNPILYTI